MRGQNFDARAVVHLVDLGTGQHFRNRNVYDRSNTHLTLSVNFGIQPAEWSVEVVNPDGRSSREFRFNVVYPPPPRITSVEPAEPVGSNEPQSFVIHGEHFHHSAKVTLRDLTRSEVFPDRYIHHRTDGQLVLRVNFTDEPALWAVEVINPNGQSSGRFRFRVVAPPRNAPAAERPSESEIINLAIRWARSQLGRATQPCATPGCFYNPRNTGYTPCSTPTPPFDHEPWYSWCARFVANCYGMERAGFETAHDMFNKLSTAGVVETQRDNIPVGSLVFWYWKMAPQNTNDDGKEYGHVGIYIGNGDVIHTGVSKDRQDVHVLPIWVVTSRLDRSAMLDRESSYLGWVAPFNVLKVLGWPGRTE
ncbi:MAG TPA: CHAP domain-containing protein [Phycisphaerales bacterium]|nr:CHAP domain-containing protein [Phycisphaerales bacterium]